MGTIRSVTKAYTQIDFDQIKADSVEQTKDIAAQLNRDDLSVGLLATSNPITPQYSPAYAKKKGTTTPNLYFTGAFYKGIFVEVNKTTLTFNSSDIKATPLEARYSKYIFGLTADSKAEYAKQLRPILIAKLKAATKL